jgi:hypothetical protein
VGARHVVEGLAALGGEAHAVGAPVALHLDALHQAFGDQLVGDAGDVAAGHHHAARQLVHAQALGRALQLRHQVEARQRGVELLAQLVRTCFSTSCVQVSRRSHRRSSSGCSLWARASRSIGHTVLAVVYLNSVAAAQDDGPGSFCFAISRYIWSRPAQVGRGQQ